MIGSSYEGFTVVMALLDPHPALKVAAPESPMVDGWMGDDWFHYGAFRQTNFDYTSSQTTKKDEGDSVPRDAYDDYEDFRRAGSAGNYARPTAWINSLWRKMIEHPAYDAFWQGQALDKLIAQHPSQVPTMWIQGLWDQEDMWGAIHCYLALEPKSKGQADHNYLVMGPWRHSQVNYDGLQSRSVEVGRRHRAAVPPRRAEAVLRSIPENGAPKADTPPVFIYNTGENHWDRLEELAAGLRGRLRRAAEAALSRDAGLRLGLRQAGAGARPTTNTFPIPPSLCPMSRARSVSRILTVGSNGWSPISARLPTVPTS